MQTFKKSSLLCLIIRGSHIQAQLGTRSESGIQIRSKRLSPALRIGVNESELVGKELKDLLQQAGMARRQAVVVLPSHRFVTLQLSLQNIPEENRDDYVRLQAERAFGDSSSHCYGDLRFSSLDNHPMALVAALPADRVEAMTAALRAAGITPLSFVPMGALLAPENSHALVVSRSGNELEIGVFLEHNPIVFRTLKGDMSSTELLREIRLTAGHAGVPFKHVAVGDAVPCREEVTALLQKHGFTIAEEKIQDDDTRPLTRMLQRGVPIGVQAVNRPGWSSFLARRGKRPSRTLTILGAAVIAVILLVTSRVGYHHYLKLKSQSLSRRSVEVDAISKKVRYFSPWVRSRPAALRILKEVATACPETGTVWVTRFETRANGKVFINAKARSESAWLKVQQNLLQSPLVMNLKTLQTRTNEKKGTTQFSVAFDWNLSGGSNHEN